MRAWVLLACSLALVGLVSAGTHDELFHDPNIRVLTLENFNQSINDGNVHLVKFYIPHQGDSQRLSALWKELAALPDIKEESRLEIDHMDCHEHDVVCEGLPSFPTICVFHDGKLTGAYKGPLELEKLRAYAHGAAHYWQPKKGHWIWENIKWYARFIRQAYSAKSGLGHAADVKSHVAKNDQRKRAEASEL